MTPPDPQQVAEIAGRGFDIPDHELLRRAVFTARATRSRGYQPRWVAVMDVFLLGSTFANHLCRRFGYDPDEQVRFGQSTPRKGNHLD